MTGRKQKIIADLIKFSVEFLDNTYWYEEHNQYQVPVNHFTGLMNWIKLDEWSLFNSPHLAPVLAEMAHAKLLELGYDVTSLDFLCGEYRFKGSIGTYVFSGEPNKNKWIAIWSGVHKAVEVHEKIKQEKAS